MNKLKILKIVNPLLLISFLAQALTGLVLFLGLSFNGADICNEIHEYNGLLMIILVLAHIALNWGWIRVNMLKR